MCRLKLYSVISALAVVILIISSYCCCAFQNEPDNFRGIKWGSHISDLTDMNLIKTDGDNTFYKRTHDDLKIGDANLSSITYSFYEGRFYCVYCDFKDKSNVSQLKAEFENLYGDSIKSHKYADKYWWNSNNLVILLIYNDISNMGNAVYYYMPIKKEMEVDKRDTSNKDK
jgi:hypothetical protein